MSQQLPIPSYRISLRSSLRIAFEMEYKLSFSFDYLNKTALKIQFQKQKDESYMRSVLQLSKKKTSPKRYITSLFLFT